MRIQADLPSIARAGCDIESLSEGLQGVVRAASQVVLQVESAVGHGGLASALQQLGHGLAKAEQHSVHALSSFGQQVQLAARTYHRVDAEIAQHARFEAR